MLFNCLQVELDNLHSNGSFNDQAGVTLSMLFFINEIAALSDMYLYIFIIAFPYSLAYMRFY